MHRVTGNWVTRIGLQEIRSHELPTHGINAYEIDALFDKNAFSWHEMNAETFTEISENYFLACKTFENKESFD